MTLTELIWKPSTGFGGCFCQLKKTMKTQGSTVNPGTCTGGNATKKNQTKKAYPNNPKIGSLETKHKFWGSFCRLNKKKGSKE